VVRLQGLVFVLLVVGSAARVAAVRPPAGSGLAPETRAARLAVGLAEEQPEMAEQVLAELEQGADTTGARIRVAVVTAEVQGLEQGRERLRAAAPDDHPEVAAIEAAWDGREVDPAARERVERSHGWIGRLAFVVDEPDDDPERAALLAEARSAVESGAATVFGTMAVLLAGVVLLAMALMRLLDGRLRFRQPLLPAPGHRDAVWLETVNLFLASMILLQAGGAPWMLLAPIPLLWPFARGVRLGELRQRLGLHGSARDALAGVVGHVAGVPLILLAAIVTAWLAGPGGASHPVFEHAGENTPWLLLAFFAVVWAPLVEEVAFRGVLYGFLRPRFRVVGSAVLSGLAFAAIHPQGWAAIPVLGMVGAWLAVLREWRGSLFAPIAAHAAHNGVIVAVIYAGVG